MKFWKKIFCAVLLIPCMLIVTACDKQKDISFEEYSARLVHSANSFYGDEFYPITADNIKNASDMTISSKTEFTLETVEEVEYGASFGTTTMELADKIVKSSESSQIVLNSLDIDRENIKVTINRTTDEKGRRANSEDTAFEDYTEVTVEDIVYTFIFNEDDCSATIYKDYKKTVDGEVVKEEKLQYAYDDVSALDVISDFYSDIDKGVFNLFYNIDEQDEMMVLDAITYYEKGEDDFGCIIDAKSPYINVNGSGITHMTTNINFVDNKPSTYSSSFNVETGTKQGSGVNYSKALGLKSMSVCYSSDTITAPTGHTNTTTPIVLELD